MKNIGSYPKVRMRRNRKSDWSRRLVQESNLSPNDLIWPIFIREGKNIKEPVKLMPGVYRYTLDKIEILVEKAINKKIPMIALFPHTDISKKNIKGSEALNKNNLVCKALRLIKKKYNEIGIMCDVALDPVPGARRTAGICHAVTLQQRRRSREGARPHQHGRIYRRRGLGHAGLALARRSREDREQGAARRVHLGAPRAS